MNIVVNVNKPALEKAIASHASRLIDDIASDASEFIDGYLEALQSSVGTIPGSNAVTVAGAKWEPLSKPYGNNHDFWYRSGELKNSIIMAIKHTETGLSMAVGVPTDSPAYDKALWNELGFMPHDSNKLIRRPLFLPMGEECIREINSMLKQRYSNVKLTLNLKFQG